MSGEKEAILLEKAQAEEELVNWAEAGRFYEEVVKIYLDKQLLDKAAEVYKKLGYSNTRAADIADTAVEYIEHNQNAIDAYKNAARIFKQINKKPEELECEAESFLISGYIQKTANDDKGSKHLEHVKIISLDEYREFLGFDGHYAKTFDLYKMMAFRTFSSQRFLYETALQSNRVAKELEALNEDWINTYLRQR
jgi:hypothetical protein